MNEFEKKYIIVEIIRFKNLQINDCDNDFLGICKKIMIQKFA